MVNLTIRQQKLVSLLKEELLKQNGSQTLEQLMIKAGYSPKTADKPSQKALSSPAVQQALSPFLDLLDEKAKLALGALSKKKIERASARDNAYISDIMIKNKQLLTGNATEKRAISIEISREIADKNS